MGKYNSAIGSLDIKDILIIIANEVSESNRLRRVMIKHAIELDESLTNDERKNLLYTIEDRT